MGRRGADLILTPHSVGEVQRSQLCTGTQYSGTVRLSRCTGIQYSGTAFLEWNAYIEFTYEMQYWNFLLYSTIDSDLAKIEDERDLTQKIVNSREKMRCTPPRPIYCLIAARVRILKRYRSRGC